MIHNFLLHHISISINDVDKSLDFYKKVLQLKEIRNTASESKTRWLSFKDGKQLHLIPRPNEQIKTNKAVHFALATTALDAFLDHLKELKIDYSDWRGTPDKSYIRDDGVRQFYFQDPDGYWIEVNDAVETTVSQLHR